MIDLTEEERDQMAHAIGHHSAKGCSVHGGRNYYVTDINDPTWAALVQRGLAVRAGGGGLIPAGEGCFHVTPDGIAAVEADPRSARKGKPFTVRFKGSSHGVHLYAETRGKAQYAAVRVVLDAFNMTAREAFRQIESCRAGYWP
jgi:hypothetical protein